MTSEDQLKALIFFHLEEHTSARQSKPVLWTEDIRHMIYLISGKKRENILYAA